MHIDFNNGLIFLPLNITMFVESSQCLAISTGLPLIDVVFLVMYCCFCEQNRVPSRKIVSCTLLKNKQ